MHRQHRLSPATIVSQLFRPISVRFCPIYQIYHHPVLCPGVFWRRCCWKRFPETRCKTRCVDDCPATPPEAALLVAPFNHAAASASHIQRLPRSPSGRWAMHAAVFALPRQRSCCCGRASAVLQHDGSSSGKMGASVVTQSSLCCCSSAWHAAARVHAGRAAQEAVSFLRVRRRLKF